MPEYDISDLDDRLTRIEFVFAQLQWATRDASPEERADLDSCGFSPEEVERLLCLLGKFASVVRTFANPNPSTIDCPGPRCRSTETDYQTYTSGGGPTAA
jgi:hypothetical protein